jgi:SAM-dependent methyltransferase
MSTSIFHKYPEDYTFDGKRVLNIGCGFAKFKAKNVVNVDAFDICKPDVVWDLNKIPLPFGNNEFDLIVANHIFEHLPNWWECFADCGRILKVGGVLQVYVPAGGSDAIWGCRDHEKEINTSSFWGIYKRERSPCNAWADENYKSNANSLKFIQFITTMENKWWINYAPKRVKAFFHKHLRNTAIEDGYIFRKISEQEREEDAKKYREKANRHQII